MLATSEACDAHISRAVEILAELATRGTRAAMKVRGVSVPFGAEKWMTLPSLLNMLTSSMA